MKTSINNLLAGFTAPFVLLFLALVTSPRTAEAAEKTVFDFTGGFGSAIFTSSSGSIETFVGITVTAGESTSGQQFSVTVFIDQRDNSTPILQAIGTSEDGVFQISGKNLRSAALQDTVTVVDTVGTRGSFGVTVNVSWKGVGTITRENERQHIHSFNEISIFKGTSNSRSAEAFGSVTDGTTNFTPGPADPTVSFIMSQASGTLTIFKMK